MKLTRVRIKDFRSFAGTHDFDVVSGVNYFVGPNNCGKSNLIRAIELALDPDSRYDPSKDRPARVQAGGAPVRTRITLTFQAGTTQPEKTLLRYAEDYENAVRKGKSGTNAASGEVHMVTSFEVDGSRKTTFLARGEGAKALAADREELIKLESQFRKVVRFGVVHSGEDLESLLKGKFRQILQLVIQDHLADKLEQANQARQAYLQTLQSELLEPLRAKVLERVQGFFPEITTAHLIPDVSTVDQTLSSVGIQLGDLATTELTEKGTGVRGAVLVSMLQYMAEQSRRSLVMAVEEPEAFLHPAGQEEIGNQLEALATRTDVSLLVTTHSPHVVSRTPDSRITELRKNGDGVTRRGLAAAGDEDRAEILGSLYRDAGLAHVLERALSVPASASAVVITEGYTDDVFLRTCLSAVGKEDLIAGVHFLPAGTAKKVVPQLILMDGATDKPVLALLDKDDNGKAAAEKLKSMDRQEQVLSLGAWPQACRSGHDVEIEDLLPQEAVKKLIARLGEDQALDGKERCQGVWHYRPSKPWKALAIDELAGVLDADTGGMVWLAEEINKRAEALRERKRRAAEARRVG